jgi:hypothetical protein
MDKLSINWEMTTPEEQIENLTLKVIKLQKRVMELNLRDGVREGLVTKEEYEQIVNA